MISITLGALGEVKLFLPYSPDTVPILHVDVTGGTDHNACATAYANLRRFIKRSCYLLLCSFIAHS